MNTVISALINDQSSVANVLAEIEALKGYDHNDVDVYLLYRQLFDAGLEVGEIAKMTGESTTTVKRINRLETLRPELLDATQDGDIAVSVAIDLASCKRTDEVQGRVLAVLEDKGKVTRKDYREAKNVTTEEIAISFFNQLPTGAIEKTLEAENQEYSQGSAAFDAGEALDVTASRDFVSGWVDAHRKAA